jgi:septal ring factor EnvC (AmiA/AmiB activator)
MTDFQEHLKSERMARRSEVRECVDDLMARTDAHAQVAMGRIENIQTNQERLKVALGREITQLEQESVTLGQEVDTLEQQNQRQDRQLSQAKRDTLAVGQQIQEARREIQEERAAGMKALLVTVSLVVACWGSTVFLQNVLLSVGSTAKAAVVPTAGKGTLALLSVSI